MRQGIAPPLPFAPIRVGFDDLPEFISLTELLSPPYDLAGAAGVYLGLWTYACRSNPRADGLFKELSALSLRRICGWAGSPTRLREAVLTSGVVKSTRRGWVLKGWEIDAAKIVEARRRDRVRSGVGPLRATIMARDEGRCAYCGSIPKKVHLDHIVPVSRGGLSTLENLVVACAPCNLAKGAKELTDGRI